MSTEISATRYAGAIRRPALLALLAARRWAEDAIVLVGAALATLHAEWRMIADPLTFQTDAFIHEFWMRRFQDPALFDDPLTEALLATGYSPPSFRLLYWLASHVVDPVFFGELLPLVLQPFAVWLVFRIVRDHVVWRPAAWTAAALFLVPWDIHRFSGGHPRAFAQPIVLLALFLLLRRRNLAAAVVPPVGLLLYPPAGVVALAIVLLAVVDRKRPHLVNMERAPWAALSVLGAAASLLLTRMLVGSQELLTAAEARRYPEFEPGGQMHFFASSTLDYLRQNYSGFNLGDSGSILAVAALFLLLVRLRNVTLLRWEVWCMPIASLVLFAAAHALLFRLYLPHRYTYSLLPFFCIAIGIVLRPTLEAWAGRTRLSLLAAAGLPLAVVLVALTVFPLGPQLSISDIGSWLADARSYLLVGLALGLLLALLVWRRTAGQQGVRTAAAAAAVFAGTVLVAEVAFADGGRSPGAASCRDTKLYRHLRTLPKDAIIAGDALDVGCIPIAARRPVVISRKLYQPWDPQYFRVIRDRMFRTVDAYYGPSVGAIIQLRERYGADYFVVETPIRERPWPGMAPFTAEVARLLRSVEVPAALRLPEPCETWRGRRFKVYSLACVAAEPSR